MAEDKAPKKASVTSRVPDPKGESMTKTERARARITALPTEPPKGDYFTKTERKKAEASVRRQAAIDAHIKASPSGRTPPKSMSIKAMNAYVARWQAHRNYHDSKLRPGGPVNPTPKPAPSAPPQRTALDQSISNARVTAGMKPLDPNRPIGATPVGVTNDMAMGHASAPPSPGRMSRALQFVGEHQGKLALGVSAGTAAVTYAKTGDVKEAAKAAAPGVIAASLPAIARGADAVGDVSLSIARAAMNEVGVFDHFILNGMWAKTAAVTGIVGGAAKGIGAVAHVASKVALPIALGAAAYQIGKAAYTGGTQAALKETGRQALGIATFGASELAIAGHDAYKSYKASKAAPDTQAFAKANASFDPHTMAHADGTGPTGRGFGHPAVQAAAQEARGVKNKTDWARG